MREYRRLLYVAADAGARLADRVRAIETKKPQGAPDCLVPHLREAAQAYRARGDNRDGETVTRGRREPVIRRPGSGRGRQRMRPPHCRRFSPAPPRRSRAAAHPAPSEAAALEEPAAHLAASANRRQALPAAGCSIHALLARLPEIAAGGARSGRARLSAPPRVTCGGSAGAPRGNARDPRRSDLRAAVRRRKPRRGRRHRRSAGARPMCG